MKSALATIDPCQLNSMSWEERCRCLCMQSGKWPPHASAPLQDLGSLRKHKWTTSHVQNNMQAFPSHICLGRIQQACCRGSLTIYSLRSFEQFENMAQTGKLADGWKCKYKILTRALLSHLKRDGEYFMPFSAGLQAPVTIVRYSSSSPKI